jgi:hypothetical protein
LNESQKRLFTEIFRPAEANLELFFANVLEAAKFATATEIKVRENQKLSAIGRGALGTEYSGTALAFNGQAISAASRSLTILRQASEQFRNSAAPLGEPRNVHTQPEFWRTLTDGREALIQALVKFNLSPQEFKEVFTIWDETATVLSSRGIEGLFKHTEGNLERFITLRGQADRGTAPHSPLPSWKYWIIAIYIGAAVFAVIACFWWFGCSWVWQAISTTAPFLFDIIDRGC